VIPVTQDMPPAVQGWGTVAIGAAWLAQPEEIQSVQIDELGVTASHPIAAQASD
jgi:hypothetical protein